MEKRKGNYEQRIAELARQVSDLKQEKEELYRQGHKHDSEEILRIGREQSALYDEGSIVMAKNIIKKLKKEREELRQEDPEKNAYEIQKLTAQINDSYKQIKAAENRQKNRQDQMTVEEITVNIEELNKSIEDLERNKAKLEGSLIDGVKYKNIERLKKVKNKIEQKREQISKLNDVLDERDVVKDESINGISNHSEEKVIVGEDILRSLEHQLQEIAKKRNEYKKLGNYEAEAFENSRYHQMLNRLSIFKNAKKYIELPEKILQLKEELARSAEKRKEYKESGMYEEYAEEASRYSSLVGEIGELEEWKQCINRPGKILELKERLARSAERRKEYKESGMYEMYAEEASRYSRLVGEIRELQKGSSNYEQEIKDYNSLLEAIEQLKEEKLTSEPDAEKMEKLHELQRRIGIMKPEDFEELYNKLPQEVAEKFKNQDKLSEEEIAEIFAKINEIEHPQPEPEPNPQPPVPTPEDTFLDKIGDWFADKWNKISNFVLFKPFKWVFKGIKAFGKKFVEIMKLKPDEMDDRAWDDVYDAEFREVKEQEAENEEPVLPRVEAEIVEEPEPMVIPLVPDTEKKVERKSQREQLKSQKQMARDIKKILKEQEGKSYSYEGYEFQNTGSLKILQSYFSGELKIEEGAKGRLLTPQNGEYMVRLKADGKLEADLERPLEVKFDENIAVEEDSISSEINVRVNENWRDPQKVQGYEKLQKPKTKLGKIFDRGGR